MLRDLSEERIRMLENRRRGEVQSKMDETPVGAEMEEVKTPQSQKTKIKEEKSKRNISKRTPEMVRDTPRRNTLRSGNSKETEEDSGEDTESADEEIIRERSPTLERNIKNLEEKTRKIELKGEDSSMAEINSMETEPPVERGEEDCVNCGVWMGTEEEK